MDFFTRTLSLGSFIRTTTSMRAYSLLSNVLGTEDTRMKNTVLVLKEYLF